MAEFEVRDVVCDYGVYEYGELKLILNSKRIALHIVELLKEDERIHRELNPIKDYPPYLDRPKHTSTPKERGADKPKVTCLNCKHLMFSDMYGECNKQLRIVNPSDTCEFAEPKERGGEK